jgi:hypothetical protein
MRLISVQAAAPAVDAFRLAAQLRDLRAMPLPDDQQRAVLSERLDEFQKAFTHLTNVSESRDRCSQAARELMASLQGLINKLRR